MAQQTKQGRNEIKECLTYMLAVSNGKDMPNGDESFSVNSNILLNTWHLAKILKMFWTFIIDKTGHDIYPSEVWIIQVKWGITLFLIQGLALWV